MRSRSPTRSSARSRVLSKSFPKGIVQSVVYDTTRFVKVSIEEVIITLAEAMILVVLVVYLFLQNWRATFIPVVAVPVSLIGTLAGLLVMGYSINTLTLFGMVLAIGIVVDDAIVVLENVERIMHEEKLPAREAALKAMREVSGPVIAIVLVLCAVFVPIAFLGGLSGELYRQFAVTISMAVIISGIVALSLTPSLCVLLLKHEHRSPGRFFQAFNRFFARVTHRYVGGVGFMVRRAGIGLALFAGMVAAGGWPVARHAGVACARRGPGLVLLGRDPARRRIAGTHRQGGARGHRDHQVQPRQPGRHRLHRLRLPRRRVPQQRGDDLRHPEALERAQASRCRSWWARSS